MVDKGVGAHSSIHEKVDKLSLFGVQSLSYSYIKSKVFQKSHCYLWNANKPDPIWSEKLPGGVCITTVSQLVLCFLGESPHI